MKGIKFFLLLWLLSSVGYAQKVQTSYLWHMQQPIYWPEESKANPNRYQSVLESHNLKTSGDSWNQYEDGKSHPLNMLQEIFGKYDRVKAYQYGPKNSVQRLLNHPNGGAQVNYSGCLIENVNSLADAGVWGYNRGWENDFKEARSWKTSGGQPRMDLTGFTFHHALAPLISERALTMELKTHKYIMARTFGGEYSKGFWPAECSFSERIIKVLVEEGFEWSVIANSHLSRTLNDYPLDYGTSGVNIDPPNGADKVATNGNNWWKGQLDGRGGTFAAPYCYQVHKAQYVDPENGQAYTIDVVPMADLLSYQNGFSSMGTGEIDANIAPFSSESQPSLVLMAHDGDNAWGGGDSYYQESVPGFANEAASKGYDPTTIQQFLNSHPVPQDDIVRVEDGSWVNAANDWGHPQFINWLWPLYDRTDYRFDPNGWTEDARNWAVITAAENYVWTAEDLNGNVDIAKVVDPTNGASSTEKAWHFFLPSLTSGYMYYGKAIDMEVKQTIAGNIAIKHAKDAIGGRENQDTTPPSVFIPQRFPYNPGGKGFGPIYGYKEVQNTSDFHIWTFAHDINGLASVELKYRTDNDGKNPLSNTENETYAGGSGVGSWNTIDMNRKAFPKDNIANDPEIDFFQLPDEIADLCYAEIRGLSNVLVDYYVEATDTKGNVFKTPIQHVYVGELNSSDEVTLNITPNSGNNPGQIRVQMSASTTVPNGSTAIYYTLDGTEPNNQSLQYNGSFQIGSPTSDAITVKAIAYDNEGNISEIITRRYTFGDIPSFEVYFKNTENWSTVNIYLYDKNSDESLPGWSWPGQPMENIAQSPWFTFDIAESVDVGIVFNDGGARQTDDLSRNVEGWYVIAENKWYDTCPSDCPGVLPVPELTVSPTGGTFENNVSITLAATNQGTIYYTMDGSIPTEQSLQYTSAISISETTRIRAIAYNESGSSELIDENYVIEETDPDPTDSYPIYFRNTNGWGQVYVYLFDQSNNTALPSWTWPGKPMSRIGNSQWYSYLVEESVEVGIVFHNGSGQQTDDLARSSEGWFDSGDNQWYDTCPTACPDDNPSDGITIRYNNASTNWSNVSLYFWNTTPTSLSTTWPGEPMTDADGDGWFEYTLSGVNCANVIFSANGAQQTVDLDLCGDGDYDDGWVDQGRSADLQKTPDNSNLIIAPYPNPTKSGFSINYFGKDKEVNIIVRDIRGVKVYEQNYTADNSEIYIPVQFAKGVYFVQFFTEDLKKNFKLIKE